MRTKKLARTSVSLITLTLAGAAMAQGTGGTAAQADQDRGGIQDIVVTATRQATNLQDTPIAITAVTSQELEDRGVKSIADLTAVVPNAQFRRVQGAFGPGVTTFIRGIGTTDTSLGGEAATAYYIDDVYYPILLGSNFDLLDIAHIEVLRGPQGTLFGRNSLAGAVNIVSRQPDPKAASAYAEVTVGGYGRHDVRAGFNLPLGDNAAVMISAMSRKRTGYQRMLDFACEMNRRGTPQLAGSLPLYDEQRAATPNYTPDNCVIGHLGGDDVRAARASLLWQPTTNLTLTINADQIWDDSENPANTTVDINPTLANANLRGQATYFGIAYDQRLMTGDPFTSYASYWDRISSGTTLPASTFYTGLKGRGGSQMEHAGELRNWGLSGKLVWGLTDDIDLTAIIGYRKMDEHHAFDNDNGPLVREQVASEIGEKYTTAELRLSGQMDLIDWVVGAFYFDAYGYFHATNYSPVNATVKTLVTTYEPNSKAFYGNATIRPLGERLGIVLGARYSWDHKFVNYSNLTDTGPHPNPGDLTFQVDPTQEKFSWKLGLNYQVSNNLLVYASAATGNSLPGYNARPLQPSQAAQFDGNDDIAYEIGAKLDLFDRKLRLNLAAFYTDFNNRPTGVGGAEALIDTATGTNAVGNQVLIPLEGGPAGSTRCRATVQTIAEAAAGPGISCINRTYYINQPATVRGFEVEYTINPIDGLMINGAVGWSKFLSPEIEARTVNRRQSNPFWTANAGIQYRIDADMLAGTITPRLDWNFEGNQVISGTSTKYNDQNRRRSVFNTRVTYENTNYDFTVAVGVTNLFNKFYYLNWFDYQANGAPETVAQPAAPRQWFVTVSKKF